MGGYVLDLSFGSETPNEVVERIRHEKPTYEINVDEHEVALLRSKLKYLPTIMHTAIIGPPESEAFQEDLRYFDMLLNAHLRYPWKRYWYEEDYETFRLLKEKVGIKTRKIPGEAGEHVAWPVEVLMIKEVEDEIDALVKKPFVSPEDPKDAEIVKNWGPNMSVSANTRQGQRELKGIDAINREGHDLGIMFKDLLHLYRKYGVKFWLILWSL